MSKNPYIVGITNQLQNLLAPQKCNGGFQNTGYATNTYWSITGAAAGPGIVPNTWGVVLLRYLNNGGNQSPWNFGRSTKGWSIRYISSNTAQMRTQSGSDFTYTYATTVYSNAFACLLWNCRADGSLWSSYSGADEHLMTLAPNSAPPDATSVQRIGRIAADIGTLAWAGGVLAVAEGTGTLSNAEMKAITNCVNQRHRYSFNSDLRGRSDLVSELDFARDWDGAATTVTAGLGSAPRTFTAGSSGGGAKTSIPESLRFFLMRQRYAARDSNRWEVLSSWIRQQSFARRDFITDAQSIIVDALVQSSGENQGLGIYQNGVAYSIGAHSDIVDASRAIDVTGLTAGSKTIALVEGGQALLTPATLGWAGEFARAVRIPLGNTFQLLSAVSVTDRLVVYGDSITVHVEPGAGTITAGAYQAWTRLVWQDYPGNGVTVEGYARRTLKDDCDTNALTDAFGDYMVTLCNGTVNNTIWIEISTNDYGFSSWGSLVTFKAAYKRLVQRLISSGPVGLKVYCQSPTTRNNENNNNAAAIPWNMPAQRTAISDLVSEIANANVIYVDGSTLVPFNGTNFPDGLHPSVTGAAVYKAAVKTILGYP